VKNPLIAALAAAIILAAPAQAEDAQGYWAGSIANVLHVVLHVEKDADGRWNATLHVPAQNLVTRVDDLVLAAGKVSFAVKKFNASYAAGWNEADKAWTGTWTQGQAAPLVLKRTDASAVIVQKPRRPQEDAIAARTPSYDNVEVTFSNDAARTTLAGTFSVPHGKGPHPAVVLIHGSGPVDRNEAVFDHKPFLILADHLARQGIAVLRYDKRGIGKSTGNFRDATTFDFADDAEAALRFLRSRSEVDTARVGAIGHSEGGLIVPLLTARDAALRFAVVLAGPGVRGELILVEQIALMGKAQGAPAEAIAKERKLNQAIFGTLASDADYEAAVRKTDQVLADAVQTGALPADARPAMLKRFGTRWFHTFLRHDPIESLKATRQPILVLNGELDLQVPSALAIAPIRDALKDNPRAVVRELPQLNHLFQTAKTGSGSEYKAIEETMSPMALDAIGSWIRTIVK
jgi:pimeloyl-ACP methyl ester carboxylesterase